MITMKNVNGGVTAPKGYCASGVCAGIRGKHSKNDMAAIICETEAVSAGMYTKNKVKAAPVVWDSEVTGGEQKIKAVIINSGIANAATGKEGYENTMHTAEIAAECLGAKKEQILVCSTGVIGMQLEMDIIEKGAKSLFEKYGRGEEWSDAAATAIMTTDTAKKEIAVETEIGGKTVTIGAMCKGSGMIHPNLGTMLGFITTDAVVSKPVLQKALRECVEKTFNMVSIDGDTSTNDTVLLLANGLAENADIKENSDEYKIFKEALMYVCTFLARKIAEDGEGATKLLTVNVNNAVSYEDAVVISKSVACSSLTKSAVFGNDANWGRIICAMGYSGGEFNPDICDVSISSEKGEVCLVKNGLGAGYSEQEATEIFKAPEVVISVDLKQGEHSATAWGCDLTYDYIKINADYRS